MPKELKIKPKQIPGIRAGFAVRYSSVISNNKPKNTQ
jgi:hypothetical protein